MDVLRPRAKEALVIGLGSGSVPTHWRRPPRRLKVDAVDLDPEVIALAESSFGLAPGTAIVGDGLNVLYVRRAGLPRDESRRRRGLDDVAIPWR